jgi:polyhydroxybutyrate depolymerase
MSCVSHGRKSACVVALAIGVAACGSKGSGESSPDGGEASHEDAHTEPKGDTGAGTKVDAFVAPKGDAGFEMHLTAQTITVGGATRTYDISLPTTCDASHLHPIVFIFHGDGGKGADMYGTAFPIEEAAAAVGDEATFVYPDGLDNNQNGSAWDIYDDPGMFPYTKGDPTGNVDVDFFDALLAKLEADGCVDKSHVYITGMSNGGYLSNQLARWRSKVVKATAPQSGGPPAGSTTPSNDYAPPNYCVGTTGPVPVLIIHGSADTVVAPENCQEAASYWDMANSCDDNAADCSASTNSLLVPPATPTTATSPSPCVTSNGCKSGYPVILCEIPGMGHTIWSEAPQTIWAFFTAH